MATHRIPFRQDDRVDVVVTTDPSVTEAWSDAERGRYLLFGELPGAHGLPSGATLFRLRPLLWFERRKLRDHGGDRFDPSGIALLEGYIEAMRAADATAGRAYHDALEPAERALLSQTMIDAMHADESLCRDCVTDVIEGSTQEDWTVFLNSLHVDDATQIISQLARHIRRISGMGPKQAF